MSQADETRAIGGTLVTTALLAGAAALGSAHLIAAIAVVQAALISTWALAGAPPAPTAVFETVPHPQPDPIQPDPLHPDPKPAARPGPALAYAVGRSSGAAVPGRIGALLIGALAAAGADIAVSVRPDSALSPVLFVVGLALPVMFVHQLVRGVVRVRVVESLSGIAVVTVCVVALSALAQLRHEPDGRTLSQAAVIAIGVSVTVAGLVDLIWSRPRYAAGVPRGFTATMLGTAAGAGAGAVVLRSTSQFSAGRAILLCAILAGVGALTAVATGFIAHGLAGSPGGRAVRSMRPVAVAVVPFTLIAPAAYVVLLGG